MSKIVGDPPGGSFLGGPEPNTLKSGFLGPPGPHWGGFGPPWGGFLDQNPEDCPLEPAGALRTLKKGPGGVVLGPKMVIFVEFSPPGTVFGVFFADFSPLGRQKPRILVVLDPPGPQKQGPEGVF